MDILKVGEVVVDELRSLRLFGEVCEVLLQEMLSTQHGEVGELRTLSNVGV